MNTIERVALAIALENVRDAILSKKPGFESLSEKEREWEAENRVEFHMSEAKAALEALCEGLEWRDNVLFLNGGCLGEVFRARNMNNEYIGFRFELLGTLHKGPHDSMEDAKDALMSRARSWIMGVET